MGAGSERSDVFRSRAGRYGIPDLEQLHELRLDRGLPVPDRPTWSDVIHDLVDDADRATLPRWYHAIIIGLSTGIVILIMIMMSGGV